MPASLELVRIALQAYGQRDCEIALALADPLIRWDERASRPDGDLVWGHDDVEHAMRRYLDGWEEYRFDVEDIAEVAPGKIVGICRERGRDERGASIDRRFGGLWVVEEGAIVSWSTYLTPKEAVRAAKEQAGGELQPPKPKAPAPQAQAPAAEQPAEAPAAAPVEEEAPATAQPEEEPGPTHEAEAPGAEEAEAPAAPQPKAAPQPEPAPAAQEAKPAKQISEEQKRAAKARAKLRKRSSKQTA